MSVEKNKKKMSLWNIMVISNRLKLVISFPTIVREKSFIHLERLFQKITANIVVLLIKGFSMDWRKCNVKHWVCETLIIFLWLLILLMGFYWIRTEHTNFTVTIMVWERKMQSQILWQKLNFSEKHPFVAKFQSI